MKSNLELAISEGWKNPQQVAVDWTINWFRNTVEMNRQKFIALCNPGC